MPSDDKKSEKPRRFPGLAPQEMLTPEEIADLRRKAKEAFYLRPAKADKKD
jgi:hypothetical protein